jgi:hypothetical protein
MKAQIPLNRRDFYILFLFQNFHAEAMTWLHRAWIMRRLILKMREYDA